MKSYLRLILSAVFGICLSSSTFAADFKPGKGVFNPQTFTLKNGLQVIVIENHRAPVVIQQIWYKNGFIDDPDGKSGIAHFLEHMMFSPDFMQSVARIGGEQNAFTGKEFTSYYQAVRIEALPIVMQMEAERMANLSTKSEKVETERKVIIEERRMRIDNSPSAILGEAMLRNFFWNHLYGRPGIGWEHEMTKLSQQDVIDFYKKWYVPNNAVLILAGDITLSKAKELAEKYYGKIPSRPINTKRNYLVEPIHRGVAQRIILKHELVNEPMIDIMIKAPSYNSEGKEHAYALEVATYLLGNGPTSLLYKKLAKEKRLASLIAMDYDPIALGPSFISISAQPAPGVKIEDLEAALVAQIDQVIKNGVTKEQVQKAQKRMVAGIQYVKDSSFGGVEEFGRALTGGLDINHVEKWPDQIMAVTPLQVNAAIKSIFDTDEKLTGLLLPAKKAPTTKPIK